MDIKDMFRLIEAYQNKLGYDYTYPNEKAQMEHLRQNLLALNQEISELTDSFPWKPWRNIYSQIWDNKNALEEIVDIFFFLGAIMSIAGIDLRDLEGVFVEKLKENHDRIERGYNNTSDERR